jgi:hypothetical protein
MKIDNLTNHERWQRRLLLDIKNLKNLNKM